jgi:FkbM family methyltransferase
MKSPRAVGFKSGVVQLCLPFLISLGASAELATATTPEDHPAAEAEESARASVALAPCPDQDANLQGRSARIRELAVEIRSDSELTDVDSTGLERWKTRDGLFWVAPENFPTMATVLAEQEVEIYGGESRGVKAGDIVIDGGAHFGAFVRSSLARGAKLVVAVELSPINIECLERTFAKEIAEKRVIVYPKGIWHEDDWLELKKSRFTWGHSVVINRRGGEGNNPIVPLTTIDKLVIELGLSRVDFIKMDIEGAESNALMGAKQTLQQFKPRLAIAAYHRGDDKISIPDAVTSAEPAYRMCLEGRGRGDKVIFFEASQLQVDSKHAR